MSNRKIVLAMIGNFLMSDAAALAAEPDPKELGRAAVQGYRQHWDRFEYFRLRYIQYGFEGDPPKTLDDVLAFRWTKSKGLTCEYVVDGPRWVCKVDGDDPPFDPKALVKDKKNPGLAWGDAPRTQRYLGNASESLRYTPRNKLGALFEGGAGAKLATDISWSTPLHLLGFRNPDLNPYDLLLAAERDHKPWSAGPPADLNGSPCVPVTFRTPNGFKTVFHLDLRRGYLPVRIQVFMEVEGKETEGLRTDAVEVRECSRDRWLPTKVRDFFFPAAMGAYRPGVREILEYDLDTRPTRDQLSVEMEAGTSITRYSKPTGEYGILLRQGERLHPDDLPRLIDISEGRRKDPLTDTAVHPAPSRNWWWYAGPAAVVVALLGVIGYRRFRRARAATT